jgi:hypothetical protein
VAEVATQRGVPRQQASGRFPAAGQKHPQTAYGSEGTLLCPGLRRAPHLSNSSRSRFPYAYLVSTSLKSQPPIFGMHRPIGCGRTVKREPNLERDGRCVQNLVKLHRNVLISDY